MSDTNANTDVTCKQGLHHSCFIKTTVEQESPPAWTQEAYCLPCSKSWGGGGVPTLAMGVSTLAGGTYLGHRVPTLARGYLPWLRDTHFGWGYPPWLGWVTPVPNLARGVPHPRTGVPPRCGWTHTCENITFPHSVGNAGGKNSNATNSEPVTLTVNDMKQRELSLHRVAWFHHNKWLRVVGNNDYFY